MDIGVPATTGAARDGPAQIIIAGDEPLDLDPLELFATIGGDDRQPAVEPRGLDLDLRQTGDPVVLEVDNQLRNGGGVGRLLPSGFVDRQRSAAQIQSGDRLGARRVDLRIGQIDPDRPAHSPGLEIEVEAPPRLGIERQPEMVNRAGSPRTHPERDIGVESRRGAVQSRGALRARAGPVEIEREITVGEIALHRDLGDRDARHRRFRSVFDGLQLEAREQRKSKMQRRVGVTADPCRLNVRCTGIIKRLGIDNLQSIPHRPADREIDRQPFERRADFGDRQRAAGNFEPFQDAGRWQELKTLAGKNSGAIDVPRRR